MTEAPRHPTARRLAWAARAAAASVAIFGALMVYAVARYPGGTWADHATRGYDPMHNFLCDLLEPVALDGRANAAAARAAMSAMVVVGAGLAVTWWLVPALFPADARRLARAVRLLGGVSTAGVVAVPLMPATSWYRTHAAIVLVAGVTGLAAAIVAVVGLARARSAPALTWIGAAMIGVVVADIALYAHQLVVVGNPSIWLSLLEVVATALLVVWLVGVAASASGVAARMLRSTEACDAKNLRTSRSGRGSVRS